MTRTAADVPPDLMELYCRSFKCPPPEFEKQAFRRCLHWHARILEPLIRKLRPAHFDRDLMLIRYLGMATGRRDVRLELEAFREGDRSRGSFARKWLCLRVSATKAAKLANALYELRERRPLPDAVPSALLHFESRQDEILVTAVRKTDPGLQG